LSILSPRVHQILQSSHTREDTYERTTISLRYLREGIPKAGSSTRSQIHS
uniref:Kinesin motor domain-containing protein n=1 Tax=Rodentolepis nana TaxID=102285 RepID=A0A0R3TSB0_RODNA